MVMNLPLQKLDDIDASRFVLFVCRTCLLLPHQKTMEPIWAAIAWSFNVALSGSWPSVDHEGRPLAGWRGKRAGQALCGGPFALTELRGDWKQYRETFKLKAHWGAVHICYRCNARKTGRPHFVDFGHFQQFDRRTHNNFVLNVIPRYVCPLLEVQGFHVDMLRHCSMHVINLGFLQFALASGILQLIDQGMYGPPPLEHQCKRLTDALRSWSYANRVPQSQCNITPGLLHVNKPGEPPFLGSKAFNGRICLAFLAVVYTGHFHVWQQIQDQNLRCRMEWSAHYFWTLGEWFNKVESFPRYLSGEQARLLRTLGEQSMEHYMQLTRLSAREGSLLWSIRPKHHVPRQFFGQVI